MSSLLTRTSLRLSRSTPLASSLFRVSRARQATPLHIRNMANIQRIQGAPGAPPVAAPYSQATIHNGTIYCSGQVPANPEGKLIEGTIQDKTRQCIQNLQAVLKAAGADLPNIIKVNVFLTDMADFAALNEEYGKWFGDNKPSRSCVAVKQLPLGVPVEIECIAVL